MEKKPVASRGRGKKGKSSANFPPVKVEYKNEDVAMIPEDLKRIINDFLNSTSTETQLVVARSILDSLRQLENDSQDNVIKFLVLVIFESEPKHPVKCLLIRQVDQMENIHGIFMKHLSHIIQSNGIYSSDHYEYPKHAKFVSRLSSCFYENFPLGVDTILNNVLKIFEILTNCMLSCKDKLTYLLSTAEKSEVNKVLHQTLHFYLNVYQKATLDEKQIYNQTRLMTQSVIPTLVSTDLPMDTKSLCAVIQITMLKSMSEWDDPWLRGFPMSSIDAYWRSEERATLCMYSALVAAAPAPCLARRLDFSSSEGVARHILALIQNIVDITDRLSGSVDVSICGARALAAASEWLNTASARASAGPKPEERDDNGSDSSEERSEPNDNEPGLYGIESDSDTEECDTEEHDMPDPWLFPSVKRAYEEGEPYMGRSLALARLLARYAERRQQHHVPAVAHLAEQIRANVTFYCLRFHPEEVSTWLKVEGGCGRGQLALLRRVGAGALLRAALAPRDLLPHLDNDHKQPHVAGLLETYIERDCSELDAEAVFERWVPPAVEQARRARTALVTDILLDLLAKAVDIQDRLLSFILPLIEKSDATTPANLKCTLFLMNVISKSNAGKKYRDCDGKWKGLIGYEVLEAAILDDDDQIGRLCMWAVCGGGGGGCGGGGRVVLALLRDGAHRPRALHADTRRALAHFLKRLEKEYRSCSENEKYREILQKLRSVCFCNLVRGANRYRRGISLFTLEAICGIQRQLQRQRQLQGHQSEWSLEEVETVLRHLDDSYDSNKQLALDILKNCPQELLRKAVTANNMESIPALLEGVSCRVRDAEGAAYKLELLVTTLPDIVVGNPAEPWRAKVESVRYAACAAALDLSFRPSYRAAPLTLLRTQLERLPLTCEDDRGQSVRVCRVSVEWSALVQRAAERARLALHEAAPLVEAASPEGHVPHLFFGLYVEPHQYIPNVYLVGEEAMTAQTMLLYAWTCAKEAWMILGLASQLLERCGLGVGVPWRALAACVARARHRAVHDHATAAFTTILRRLMEEGMEKALAEAGELAVAWAGGADCTRRAAGLAALVLAVARAAPDLRYLDLASLAHIHQAGAMHAVAGVVRAREPARAAHAALPALVRRALQDADSPDAALQWACVGVVGAALRRIAGPHAPGGGGGGGGAPSERGRLRTSVFISRYPGLYECILECLERGRAAQRSMVASVACSLLVVSRLLPDAGAPVASGTPVALHAGVEAACASPAYHTRRLAAAAAAASLPPDMYLEHAGGVLKTLTDRHTPKNLCHGLILRLLAMIDEVGELPWARVFAPGLPPTLWIVDSPCFPLVHEYLNLIIVLVKRYPSSLEAGYRSALGEKCGRAALGRVSPGAQLCAARALGVAAALLPSPRAAHIITNGLNSNIHEVCRASLECLISALGDAGDAGETGETLPVGGAVWAALGEGEPALLDRLSRIMQTHVDVECRRRSLRVLALEGAHLHIFGETQPRWSDSDTPVDVWVVERLSWYMDRCEYVRLWHHQSGVAWARGAALPCPGGEPLYARALATHLRTMPTLAAHDAQYHSMRMWMQRVSGCVWAWSGAQGAEGARDAARDLLREHGTYMLTFDDDHLVISLLLGAAAARLGEGGGWGGRPAPAPAPALLLALALLDFGLDDRPIDELEENQSSDCEIDSELYEEGIWTDRCSDILTDKYAQTHPGQTITPYVKSLIEQYHILQTVCGIHLTNFYKLLNGETEIGNLHYKVELFFRKLNAFDASIQPSS